MVMFETLENRTQRNIDYMAAAAVVHTQAAAALWHQPVHPLVLAVEVDKDRVRDQTITRNKAVIAFFSTQFMLFFFAKMLFHLRSEWPPTRASAIAQIAVSGSWIPMS